jgi:phosphatidylglycerophosphate synthase
MLDNSIRVKIDPIINAIGLKLAKLGFSANMVTIIGFAIGVLAGFSISFEAYILGLVLLLLSRIMDGLDGAVARFTKPTDLGGYLDITLDFMFYGIIPLSFAIANPEQNALAASVLLFAFYANGASFLAFATMAEKRGLTDNARGSKSLLYTVGLAEATETIVVFVLFCLIPAWFAEIAYAFTAVCFITTFSRIMLAVKTFK